MYLILPNKFYLKFYPGPAVSQPTNTPNPNTFSKIIYILSCQKFGKSISGPLKMTCPEFALKGSTSSLHKTVMVPC